MSNSPVKKSKKAGPQQSRRINLTYKKDEELNLQLHHLVVLKNDEKLQIQLDIKNN